MKLEEYGLNEKIRALFSKEDIGGFEIGRVVAEHKERYMVRTEEGETEAEITGNMRFSAAGREDFPAVGDWVAILKYDELAIIHKILPRFSIIKRKAVGHQGEIQIIATNIDYAFLVQAADRDFNINRLERYLTICNSSKVSPIIVLTKTDLAEEEAIKGIIKKINGRIEDVPVVAISNETRHGYESLENLIEAGKTYCLLGSSGVGKSSLLNNLSGRAVMRTDAISKSTNKGRHVTSHRELILLDNGGILIDNPGMREVGIADTEGGLEKTFDRIIEFGGDCKYSDCSHTHEAGCAVVEAVNRGDIPQESYENYLKMEKEKAFFESSATERKKREKSFGKIVKDYKKNFRKK